MFRWLAPFLLVLLACLGPAQADSLVVQTCGTLPLAYAPGATRLDTVDVNGNKCTSGSGTSGYAQGSATSGQLGPLDQTATTTSTPTYLNGTTNPLSTDTSGGLRVNCITGCGGSGGTAQADKSAFTEGTTELTPIGGEYVSGGAGNCTTGDACAAQITIDRMLYVNIGKVGGAVTGTAGTAGTGVVTVQGIAGMTPLLANPSTIATWGLSANTQNVAAPTNNILTGCQFTTTPATISTTNVSPIQCDNANNVLVDLKTALPAGSNLIGGVNVAQVNGVTTLTGTGATGTGAQRVTVATDQATNAGAALVKGGVGVVNGGSFYQAVAASQTATVLQSSTGATGDYLSHCVIYPTSTSPGVVTVFDSTNTAANSAILFPGGSSSTSNLVPFAVPVGAVSVNGAWKVTTGSAVSVVCYGKFS